MTNNQINWQVIDRELPYILEDFAIGTISGENFYQNAIDYASPEVRSQVRNLLRNRGVAQARQLARKALRRRGVSI